MKTKQNGRYGLKDSWSNANKIAKHFGFTVIFSKKLIKYFFLKNQNEYCNFDKLLENLYNTYNNRLYEVKEYREEWNYGETKCIYRLLREDEIFEFIKTLPNFLRKRRL